MTRLFALAGTLIASTLAIGVSTHALARSPAFTAVPTTQIAKPSTMVMGESLWSCGSNGCTASKATARPAIVCAQAVRKLGKLESFSVAGQAFDAAALAKCNARAKG